MSTNTALLDRDKVDSAFLERLLEARKNGEVDFVLIDIREPYEYEAGHIVGVDHLLPTTQFRSWAEILPQKFPDQPVILTCRTANRTGQVQQILREQLGMNNVINHAGGIVTYRGEVASGMEGAHGV